MTQAIEVTSPFTVIEVVRREQSVVELRRVQDPVQRYIDDAFAVALSRDVPTEALRVIPTGRRVEQSQPLSDQIVEPSRSARARPRARSRRSRRCLPQLSD